MFVELREGRFRAYGRKLPRPTVEESMAFFSTEDDWPGWDETDWTEIPADFWLSGGIDWDGCHADGRDGAYALIVIDCESLLKIFPMSTSVPVQGVFQVGDTLVLREGETSLPLAAPRRGRRPFNWDEFHIEMAGRVQRGPLPAKQEALIAEMQDWCKAKWGLDVGRSTLLQKLKPYYDAFG